VIASARTYRLMLWRDQPKEFRRLPSGLAIGWVRSWLRSSEQRAEVLEAFEWLQPGARRSKGMMNERELNAYVLPRIERALMTGELLLVERMPVAGWKPPIQKEEKPIDKGRDSGPTTGTKTWIEFQVTDMSGKPVADVKYEAHLPDGTKKEGSTDKDGLVRFDDLDPGICDFKLVEYDGDAVESLDDAKRREKSGAGAAGKALPPPPDDGKDLVEDLEDELFVLAAEIKLLGDTLLTDHPVKILDPDTGEQVGKDLVTDEKGVVHAEVPENKPYRIEIVDEELTVPEPPPLKPDPPGAVLVCVFEGPDGKPLPNEDVEVHEDGKLLGTLETDENGHLRAPSPLGACELVVREQKFVAHSMPIADGDAEANWYHFTVEAKE